MRNDRKKSKELNFRDRVDPIRFRKLLRFQKQRQGLFRLKVFPGTSSDAARLEFCDFFLLISKIWKHLQQLYTKQIGLSNISQKGQRWWQSG